MRRSRWLGLLLGPWLLMAAPHADAWAARHKKVEWTEVDVRSRAGRCDSAPVRKAHATGADRARPGAVGTGQRAPEARDAHAAASCSASATPRVTRMLKTMLQEASRRADWGKGSTLRLSASITDLRWEQYDDVLRLEVGVVGRIVGAASVRSRIRVGGRPADRSKLEHEALQIVSTGLVTRLADIARTAAAPPKR